MRRARALLVAVDRAAKRLIDVVAAAGGLVVLTPLLVVVALLVRRRHGAPVLYRSERAGRHERPFGLIKFRTMTDERDTEGRLLPDDRRLTPLGRWLRSFSLDELPQLWNVLRGDMSLVGPRPLPVAYGGRYSAEERSRHQVRPGITGLAQVSGRNLLSWDDRLALDVEYVARRNLLLDLRILARTVGTVVRRRGVSAEGHVTMSELRPELSKTGDWR